MHTSRTCVLQCLNNIYSSLARITLWFKPHIRSVEAVSFSQENFSHRRKTSIYFPKVDEWDSYEERMSHTNNNYLGSSWTSKMGILSQWGKQSDRTGTVDEYIVAKYRPNVVESESGMFIECSVWKEESTRTHSWTNSFHCFCGHRNVLCTHYNHYS